MLAIIYGIISAVGWGAADFSGGLASRKVNPFQVVFYAEFIGIPILLALIFFNGEAPPAYASFLLAMLAGSIGTFGLALLYRAMSSGLMSIATPVSALLAAVLPVVVGLLVDGLPRWLTLGGFGFALLAVWLISQGEAGVTDILAHLADLKLPLLAGLCFGSYFIIMHAATKDGATFFPMLASRSGGALFMVIYLLAARQPWVKETPAAWGLIALNGALDLLGNTFFILAGQAGRLDVAAVLSSLYPGATVALAWFILKERLSRSQWLGIITALIAIVLMTI